MITVNSISGGKTSCYMAVHYPADVEIFALVCIDYPPAAPKDPAILKYALDKLDGNFIASAESVKTLRVMMQLEQLIGKEIVWVRGESFDTIIDRARCLPTWKRRFCTTDLKIKPMFEYLYWRYGQVKMRIGFRGDEPERMIKALQPGKELFHSPYVSRLYGQRKQMWDNFNWRETEFVLAKTFHFEIVRWWKMIHPEFDFPLDSNCRGCHHKIAELIKQNYEEDPEILEWFSLQEKKKYNTWHDDGISYDRKFLMQFTERIDFDYPGCSTGFCTD